MSRHITWQRGIALSAALIVLMLNAGVASADTDVSFSGTVGMHHLRDTNAKPGVKCRFQEGGGSGEQILYQLTVKPPVIFAVNKTGARQAARRLASTDPAPQRGGRGIRDDRHRWFAHGQCVG